MTRFAAAYRIAYVEEPITDESLSGSDGNIEVHPVAADVEVWVPRLPPGLTPREAELRQERLLNVQLRDDDPRDRLLWYYTPMALAFSRHLPAARVIYDCMDELAAFHGAPRALKTREAELMKRADEVFCGGRSLHQSRCRLRPRVHLFPSSVDAAHFGRARGRQPSPADQAGIARPRLGFYGVLDERFDIPLIREVAAARPDWQLVLIGPTAKIDPAALPQASNIHYLGPKTYAALPEYLAGWDVALLPFAQNDATRFISPTKTPEYLAGGVPVVSTPVADVVSAYGDIGAVWFGATPAGFIAAIETALSAGRDRARFHATADRAIQGMSWDDTCAAMRRLLHLRLWVPE